MAKRNILLVWHHLQDPDMIRLLICKVYHTCCFLLKYTCHCTCTCTCWSWTQQKMWYFNFLCCCGQSVNFSSAVFVKSAQNDPVRSGQQHAWHVHVLSLLSGMASMVGAAADMSSSANSSFGQYPPAAMLQQHAAMMMGYPAMHLASGAQTPPLHMDSMPPAHMQEIHTG